MGRREDKIYNVGDIINGYKIIEDLGYLIKEGNKVKRHYIKCMDINGDTFIIDQAKINIIQSADGTYVYKYDIHKKDESMSYPEKVMFNILKCLNIEFKHNKNLPWSKNKKYDFYIPSLNCIIEMHGMQHYNCHHSFNLFNNICNPINDFTKKTIAIQNGVKFYYEIDCRYSNISYIKDSIENSGLYDIVDFNNIDWKFIDIESQKHVAIQCCEMFNNDENVKDIALAAGLTTETVIRHIRNGYQNGLCTKEYFRTYNTSHSIIEQYDLNYNPIDIYLGYKQASLATGVSMASIMRACSNKTQTAGGYIWKKIKKVI